MEIDSTKDIRLQGEPRDQTSCKHFVKEILGPGMRASGIVYSAPAIIDLAEAGYTDEQIVRLFKKQNSPSWIKSMGLLAAAIRDRKHIEIASGQPVAPPTPAQPSDSPRSTVVEIERPTPHPTMDFANLAVESLEPDSPSLAEPPSSAL